MINVTNPQTSVFFTLPREIQKEILNHCSIGKVIQLSSVVNTVNSKCQEIAFSHLVESAADFINKCVKNGQYFASDTLINLFRFEAEQGLLHRNVLDRSVELRSNLYSEFTQFILRTPAFMNVTIRDLHNQVRDLHNQAIAARAQKELDSHRALVRSALQTNAQPSAESNLSFTETNDNLEFDEEIVRAAILSSCLK